MGLSTRRCTLRLLCTLFFWSAIHVQVSPVNGLKSLYFQLVLSKNEQFDNSGYIPAVDLALSLINENSSILPEYELKYTDVVDPQVSYSSRFVMILSLFLNIIRFYIATRTPRITLNDFLKPEKKMQFGYLYLMTLLFQLALLLCRGCMA